jgi:hypothetical protein
MLMTWPDVDMLTAVMDHETTRTHDKIFGIYAILEEAGYSLPKPDYDAPLAMVFETVARECVRITKKLVLLPLAIRENNRTMTVEIPSWVPDWSITNRELRSRRGGPQPGSRFGLEKGRFEMPASSGISCRSLPALRSVEVKKR